MTRFRIVAITVFCLLFLASSTMRAADNGVLANATMAVRVEQDGRIFITGKQSGHLWRQIFLPTPGEHPAEVVEGPTLIDGVIHQKMRLPGTRRDGSRATALFEIAISIDSKEPDLRVEFQPHTDDQWQSVEYPFGFVSDADDMYFLFPHAEGLLIPVRKDHPDFVPLPNEFNHVYDGYGCYCACLGLVNWRRGDGMLCSFDTPELVQFEMVDATVHGSPESLPRISWRANKNHLDAPRCLTFTFSNDGGYVSLAKHYSRRYQATGSYRTLEQKAAETPAVERLAGAPIFWIDGTPDDVLAIAAMMRADGIDRAVIEIPGNRWWQPERFAEELQRFAEVIPQVVDRGYLVSHYDQYRDGFKPDENAPSHLQARTEAYPDLLERLEDGSCRNGFPPAFVINPEAALALAEAAIPPDIDRFGCNGRFIDCAGTCSFWEGEDWNPRQPLDAIGASNARKRLLHFVRSQGLVVGTEGGIDCLLADLHWLETPMSLVRWTASSLVAPSVQSVTPLPEYQLNLSTNHRIPFYSLVHHAEAVSTWRWEDGFSRLPQHWQQKNLWSVLYGNPPMFFVNREHFLRWRKEIAQTYQYVCRWVQAVAFSELESHRFLTQNRKVQESIFSNGLGVVVNFGEAAYETTDGQVVPPHDYRTFASGATRIYSTPPVAKTSYDASNSKAE